MSRHIQLRINSVHTTYSIPILCNKTGLVICGMGQDKSLWVLKWSRKVKRYDFIINETHDKAVDKMFYLS